MSARLQTCMLLADVSIDGIGSPSGVVFLVRFGDTASLLSKRQDEEMLYIHQVPLRWNESGLVVYR